MKIKVRSLVGEPYTGTSKFGKPFTRWTFLAEDNSVYYIYDNNNVIGNPTGKEMEGEATGKIYNNFKEFRLASAGGAGRPAGTQGTYNPKIAAMQAAANVVGNQIWGKQIAPAKVKELWQEYFTFAMALSGNNPVTQASAPVGYQPPATVTAAVDAVKTMFPGTTTLPPLNVAPAGASAPAKEEEADEKMPWDEPV